MKVNGIWSCVKHDYRNIFHETCGVQMIYIMKGLKSSHQADNISVRKEIYESTYIKG